MSQRIMSSQGENQPELARDVNIVDFSDYSGSIKPDLKRLLKRFESGAAGDDEFKPAEGMAAPEVEKKKSKLSMATALSRKARSAHSRNPSRERSAPRALTPDPMTNVGRIYGVGTDEGEQQKKDTFYGPRPNPSVTLPSHKSAPVLKVEEPTPKKGDEIVEIITPEVIPRSASADHSSREGSTFLPTVPSFNPSQNFMDLVNAKLQSMDDKVNECKAETESVKALIDRLQNTYDHSMDSILLALGRIEVRLGDDNSVHSFMEVKSMITDLTHSIGAMRSQLDRASTGYQPRRDTAFTGLSYSPYLFGPKHQSYRSSQHTEATEVRAVKEESPVIEASGFDSDNSMKSDVSSKSHASSSIGYVRRGAVPDTRDYGNMKLGQSKSAPGVVSFEHARESSLPMLAKPEHVSITKSDAGGSLRTVFGSFFSGSKQEPPKAYTVPPESTAEGSTSAERREIATRDLLKSIDEDLAPKYQGKGKAPEKPSVVHMPVTKTDVGKPVKKDVELIDADW
uniref:Uncharacterized protein n=1 Tax=Rhizoctonia cerealis phyllomonavirus TaxID=3068671 RepID=A0AA51BSG5_9MONO|nr:MAG: hypothetical protein [Rhizoctonia cerealis phyllomonavirus]